MFILVWITNSDDSDHWKAFDNWADAHEAYCRLYDDETTYTVSLCATILSTDYKPIVSIQKT